MRNRENRIEAPAEHLPRVAVIRRKSGAEPQRGSVEKKLQADVAAWLRGRRNGR